MLDVPIPHHMETTVASFRAKYEIVKQREIKKKLIHADTLELSGPPPGEGNRLPPVEPSFLGKGENLMKGVKGRKPLQMAMKR